MADFKTHVSVGAYTGFFLMIGTYIFDWVSNLYMSVIIFFLTLIGSFLPDMDSDSGLPIQIIFGIYSLFAAAMTFFVLREDGLNIYLVIFFTLSAYTFVLYILKPLFKKYTSHRGIFHSVPAVLISFFSTLLMADLLRVATMDKFIIALSVSAGYFSHLLLDEIYSVNFLMGKSVKKRRKKKFKNFFKDRFGFKRSFGTALDFGFNQRAKYPAVIAYLLLGFLVYMTYPLAQQILREIR